MKTKILIFSIFLLFPITIFAQTLSVHKNDGTLYQVELSEIDSITFSSSGGGSAIPCPGIPTIAYEGQTYNTVLIGSQCWLKENLNVGTKVSVSTIHTDNSTIEKFCYDDADSNCSKYGGLYEWSEAMQYSDLSGLDWNTNHDIENVQGICPNGWHIPSMREYEILEQTVSEDANALKAIGEGEGDGAGVNTSGFSALLGGNHIYNESSAFYQAMGGNGNFIIAGVDITINGAIYTAGMDLYKYDDDIRLNYGQNRIDSGSGKSVRCIKN